MVAAARAWLEAEEDDEYSRTHAAFHDSAAAWLRARGWEPPCDARTGPVA
jgi:hypothetical protein